MAGPISRRGLLQLSYRTAAALGISGLASAQDARPASDSDSASKALRPLPHWAPACNCITGKTGWVPHG